MPARSHYTPLAVAETLIASSDTPEPRLLADFCVGDGSLVAAAARRWPEATYLINDIDRCALERAISRLPSPISLSQDFLSLEFADSLASICPNKCDLVVLNPPFSSSSNRKFAPTGTYSHIRCSYAMAFILSALDYIHDNGELLAILPSSTLHSDIDADAREALCNRGSFSVLTKPRFGIFPGIDATTYTVRISRSNIRSIGNEFTLNESDGYKSDTSRSIIRGNVSVRKVDRQKTIRSPFFIHTTSIQSGRICERYAVPQGVAPNPLSSTNLSAVLIPRVGRITTDSICAIDNLSGVHLSECLFAVICESASSSEVILSDIIASFGFLKSIYHGTGAQYITRTHLSYFLDQHIPDKHKFLLTRIMT